VLPDGRRILASSRDRGISANYGDVLLVDLETGKEEVLIERGYDGRYLSSGHVVFGRGGNLMAVAFDVDSGKVSGEPVAVVPDVGMDSLFAQAQVALAANGTLAFAPGGERALGRISWVDRMGVTGDLETDPRLYGVLDLSPDDSRLAVQVGDVMDYIWIFDLDRHEGRILSRARPGGWPRWSSSGERLAFIRRTPEAETLVLADVDADTEPIDLLVLAAQSSPTDWSLDDRSVVVEEWSNGRFGVLELDPADSPRADIEWMEGTMGVFSPDGKWLAYMGTKTGAWEVYVRSWPKGDVVRQISTAGGIEPKWCPCGELFYRAGDTFWSVEIQTDPELEWRPPEIAFEADFIDTPGVSFDISSDGDRLYVVKQARSDISDRIHVVANWSGEVDRAVREGQ